MARAILKRSKVLVMDEVRNDSWIILFSLMSRIHRIRLQQGELRLLSWGNDIELMTNLQCWLCHRWINRQDNPTVSSLLPHWGISMSERAFLENSLTVHCWQSRTGSALSSITIGWAHCSVQRHESYHVSQVMLLEQGKIVEFDR